MHYLMGVLNFPQFSSIFSYLMGVLDLPFYLMGVLNFPHSIFRTCLPKTVFNL